MPKYENSVIYKLKHNEDYDDTNIYVGSTSNFKNRKYNHKTKCNNEKTQEYNFPVYKYIRNNGNWDEWVMIPIEEYSCNSKKELEVRERHHIDLLRPALNKIMPCRTNKEYYQDNKEIIKKRAKDWDNDNKDKRKDYKKKYRNDNKDKIAKSEKKFREDNKDKIKEYFKQYHIDNKEKKIKKSKEYREANKGKVICDNCGCEVEKLGLKTHKKTSKCLKLQEENVAR